MVCLPISYLGKNGSRITTPKWVKLKKVALKDGSQLIMASDCYVDVNFTQETRQIKLIDGEIYIETAKDAQHRPFIVETKNGSVEALGTQFTVRQENSEQTKVKVYKHAVAIEPENSSKRQILKQGQRAFLTKNIFQSLFLSIMINRIGPNNFWL